MTSWNKHELADIFIYLHFFPYFFIKGGASDDFAKAKAHVPFAVTLELPPTHSYER